MKHRNLMLVGTASGVGKSATVTALCRIFKRKGVLVCPFKAQNMALNSYVTKDGKEMGRAQAVQAEAIGLEPKAWMNPILLKPSGKGKIQVILEGEVYGNLSGREYHAFKASLIPRLEELYQKVRDHYELSIIEGAGSPAEINMLEEDISNFGMARIANAPVILVADIDKGGVFASIYGTIMLLKPEDRARVKGVLINKFRGDVKVLEPGIVKIEKLTGVPVLGVLPYGDFQLEEEDSLSSFAPKKTKAVKTKIAVLSYPHLSNMTDFDALQRLEEVEVTKIQRGEEVKDYDILILPGSKNTIEDFHFLEERGFVEAIETHVKAGKILIGICGGFQMLGKSIADPEGLEGEEKEVKALGYLDMETVMGREKQVSPYKGRLKRASGILAPLLGEEISGYEIHQGRTTSSEKDALGEERILLLEKGNVWGSYLHGIFDEGRVLEHLLGREAEEESYQAYRERQWQLLEELYAEHIDLAAIEKIIEEGVGNEF